jgi:hypothetical protein
MAETIDNLILYCAKHRDELGRHRHVIRRRSRRQKGTVFGRQAIRLRERVKLYDATSDHRSEPLSHVSLIENRTSGDVSRG